MLFHSSVDVKANIEHSTKVPREASVLLYNSHHCGSCFGTTLQLLRSIVYAVMDPIRLFMRMTKFFQPVVLQALLILNTL